MLTLKVVQKNASWKLYATEREPYYWPTPQHTFHSLEEILNYLKARYAARV